MKSYLPILYEAGETAFTSLGLGYCDCISCTVTETLNALEDYQCTMVYPLNGELATEFHEGRVLLVLQDDTEAALSDRETFIIYSTFADTSAGTITVYAQQEAVYRAKFLVYNQVKQSEVYMTPYQRMYNGDDYAFFANPGFNQEGVGDISFSSDITNTYNFPYQLPRSLLNQIQGDENSLLQICGGELKPHRRNIALLKSRGSDNGAVARYGKNLVKLTIETNAAESYNALLPYWTHTDNDTGAVTLVTGGMYGSSTGSEIVINTTKEMTNQHTMLLDVTSDLKAYDGWEATDENPFWQPFSDEVYYAGAAKLNDLAPGTISVTYSAEITQDLDDANDPIELGDTVLVQHPILGVNQKMKVQGRTFNVLTRRHDSLTVGSVEKSLTRAIRDLVK